MKVLWISKYGSGLALAMRLDAEPGMEVSAFLPAECKDIYDGMIEKISLDEGYFDHIADSDLVVCDDESMGAIADQIRNDYHKPVYGGSRFSDRLENDREFAHQVWDSVGIVHPANKTFTSYDKAIKYVKGRPAAYAIKPSGQANRAFTYVAESPEDTLFMLEKFSEAAEVNEGTKISLQDRIEGLEFGFCAYFNGKRFLDNSVCVTIEHKTLMDRGGPNTGGMGSLCFYIDQSHPLYKFYLMFTKRMEPILVDRFYGSFDINVIITQSGAYALENTVRWGYPEAFNENRLYDIKLSTLLHGIASSSLDTLNTFQGLYSTSVMLYGWGYPFVEPEDLPPSYKGLKVDLNNVSQMMKVFPLNVKLDKRYGYVNTGTQVLSVVGVGYSPEESKQDALAIIQDVHFPNGFYREDIGDKWQSKYLPKLHEWKIYDRSTV